MSSKNEKTPTPPIINAITAIKIPPMVVVGSGINIKKTPTANIITDIGTADPEIPNRQLLFQRDIYTIKEAAVLCPVVSSSGCGPGMTKEVLQEQTTDVDGCTIPEQFRCLGIIETNYL